MTPTTPTKAEHEARGVEWRCFHCDEVFTAEEAAREHFGPDCTYTPACKIDIAEYRRMEQANRMQANRIVALLEEEERGYEKGLLEAQALRAASGGEADADPEPLVFTYTNWRGKTEVRTVIPQRVWYGTTDWYTDPHWFLRAFDFDKQADRDFVLARIAAPPAPSQDMSASEMREAAAAAADSAVNDMNGPEKSGMARAIARRIRALPLTKDPA